MIIKVCTCTQCKFTKRRATKNQKAIIKRLLNKRRRRISDNDMYKISNWYWA